MGQLYIPCACTQQHRNECTQPSDEYCLSYPILCPFWQPPWGVCGEQGPPGLGDCVGGEWWCHCLFVSLKTILYIYIYVCVCIYHHCVMVRNGHHCLISRNCQHCVNIRICHHFVIERICHLFIRILGHIHQALFSQGQYPLS